jgi:hypothetical protein
MATQQAVVIINRVMRRVRDWLVSMGDWALKMIGK